MRGLTGQAARTGVVRWPCYTRGGWTRPWRGEEIGVEKCRSKFHSDPGGADRGKTAVPGDSCYLCEVIAGRADKGIVEQTDKTVTLVNWAQFELGQVCVIPRRHAPTLFDLTDEEAVAVIRAVRRTADALVRAYDPDGLNLIQNNGVIAGQVAPHFHMHVVPRRKSGSDWGNGPPHLATLEGKTPTRPDRDVIISLERE
jgi:diadenosine tetraphosphate (Ap4A) HIT family hydrolase